MVKERNMNYGNEEYTHNIYNNLDESNWLYNYLS
jgi:hypothetical protein